MRARTEASDDRGQRFPIEREIRGTETRDKGTTSRAMLSTSFETNQKKAVVVRRREDRARRFSSFFSSFSTEREERIKRKNERNFSRFTYRVVGLDKPGRSVNLRRLLRPDDGKLRAAASSAHRRRRFFERDEKKGISVSKDVSFRVTHTDVLFPIRREKDRERERTNETYNSSFLHHTSAKKTTTKRVFCRRRI